MIEICKETATNPAVQDKATDFINYVFSFDHRPHNYKTLVPKGFADGVFNPDLTHYCVKEDGEIKAMIDLLRAEMTVGDEKLAVGLIGNVSVHPYARSRGYMKKLMACVLEDAKAEKLDLLALGGQRQRYGYFGFEKAGIGVRFDFNSSNIRHAFGDTDASHITLRPIEKGDSAALDLAFRLNEAKPVRIRRERGEMLNILRTWDANADVILKDGVPCGILVGKLYEISLLDEGDFAAVLKAAYSYLGEEHLSLTVPTWERERIAFLSSVCENETLVTCEQIKILNLEKTVAAFLAVQAKIKPLCDAELSLPINGAPLNIKIHGGVPKVSVGQPGEKSEAGMSEIAAVSYLFGLNGLLGLHPEAGNLFPLPFWVSPTDLF